MTNEILNSTITAESGSTHTLRDAIDYIISIILVGLNPTNGCWYGNSERVEWQLKDAIDDKQLIDSIMEQYNNHVMHNLIPAIPQKAKDTIDSAICGINFLADYIEVRAHNKETTKMLNEIRKHTKELTNLI